MCYRSPMSDKNNIHVQARAVVIQDDHILLCKTTGLQPDFYFLPGGHIEHGESAKDSILRELSEEIGFDFTINRFLGCMEFSFDPQVMLYAKCHTHEYNFIFEASSATLTPPHMPLQQIEKHIEIVWLPLHELTHIDLRPDIMKTQIPTWLSSDFHGALQSKMTPSH